jgi:hypothetical protein
VRLLRDVVVQRAGPTELIAVSGAAGLIDEEMTLDVIGGGASLGLKVRVVESTPVVYDGSVRHRLRLAVIDGCPAKPAHSDTPPPMAGGPDAVEM